MSGMFAIEPTDHWRVGDRAFCLRSMRIDGKPVLEAGRVYEVTKARQHPAMMNDRVALAGVTALDTTGISTSAFICLRRPGSYLAELSERSRHCWSDAYHETALARRTPPPPRLVRGAIQQGETM